MPSHTTTVVVNTVMLIFTTRIDIVSVIHTVQATMCAIRVRMSRMLSDDYQCLQTMHEY